MTAAAEEALEKLRSLRYVNDETFAKNWARSRAQSRGYGPKRIELELKTKGIEPALIREVVGELFGPGDGAEAAKLVLQKRFKGKNLSESKTLRRAAAFLQRCGYDRQVIFSLLRYPSEDD